jgi:stage II sporulation protein D
VRAESSPSKLSVVNVLPLDDYLKGVVPNELPPSFGYEALRAQAVAARNYAIRPREKSYQQFDICDSVMCQVYFGYSTEHPLSNKAVEETAGLVALYKGDVITTLYSSATGGFSESYEFAFTDPGSTKFPSTPRPYLKGRHDIHGHIDYSSEEAARKFYTSSPPTHDVESSNYRWNRDWTRTELETALNMNLAKLSQDRHTKPFVQPEFKTTSKIGTLKDIKVLRRGVSGKAMELEIKGTNGTWKVQKELNIRRLMTKAGKALPSANIVIDKLTDSSGNITGIKVHGGGFGHGVGMSQYGAKNMAGKGFRFEQILQHYYTGVALGTVPAFLTAADCSRPLRVDFFAPEGKGILHVENEGVDTIVVQLNGKMLTFDHQPEVFSHVKFDVSHHLNPGKNEVIFYPPSLEKHEGLSQKMWIEVVKAK